MSLSEKLEYLKEQYQIGNYGRVERTANILIDSKVPEYLKAGMLFKGFGFLYQNRDAEALSCFDKVVTEFPNEPQGYEGRFNTNLKLGEFVIAKIDAMKLCSFDTENTDYMNNVIVVDEHLNNFESVIEYCDRILNVYPDDDNILFTKASANLNIGQFEKAIDDYLRVLRVEGIDDLDKGMIYNDVGFAYSKLSNFEKSIEYSRLALEYDSNPFTYNNLGYAMAKLGKIEEGLNYVDLSIEMDSENSYAYKNRALIYMLKLNFDNAKRDLEKAKTLNYEIDFDNEVNELLVENEKLRTLDKMP